MTKDMKFVVCDYFATGEGRTICVLITYINPREADYEIKPSYGYTRDGKLQLNPGTLKTSENDILYRDFKEIFGDYLAIGAEYLDKDAFINRFGRFVPEFVIKSINEPMGNFRYFAEIHYNLS